MDKRVKTQPQQNDNLELLCKRLQGGYVTRYHTRPELTDGQDVASHTWRAVVILQTLYPTVSKNCLLYLLYHDVVEAEVGDLPATTKWAHKDLAKLLNKIEHNYEKQLRIGKLAFDITAKEKALCDIADKLELVLHCDRLMQKGVALAQDVFLNGVNYLKNKYGKEDYFAKIGVILDYLIQNGSYNSFRCSENSD